MQGRGPAGANRFDQHTHAFDLDQFAGEGGGGVGGGLVVFHDDGDFAVVNLEGVGAHFEGEGVTRRAGGAGRVFHAEHETAEDVRAVDGERTRAVGDQADFDRGFAHQAGRFGDVSRGDIGRFNDFGGGRGGLFGRDGGSGRGTG